MLRKTLRALMLVIAFYAVCVGCVQTASAQDTLPLVAPGINRFEEPRIMRSSDNEHLIMLPSRTHASVTSMGSGGPDEFGYTWTDVRLDWIDAREGGTAIEWFEKTSNVYGPIPLPFTMEFYEGLYDQVWITSGYVAFQATDNWRTQPLIPTTVSPNNIVAPYATPITTGTIYYRSGGQEPNRYFVVEWYKAQQSLIDNVSELTYELVLHENGSITFQYLNMNYVGAWRYCGSTGIEDATGEDGLNIGGMICTDIGSNRAIDFSFPPPAVRVRVRPDSMSGMIAPNAQTDFELLAWNRGNMGIDSFDVTVDSNWPVQLFGTDGAPLTDRDANGLVDTPPIEQGGMGRVRLAVDAPPYLNVGDSNPITITMRSQLDPTQVATATIGMAYSPQFAQSYIDVIEDSIFLFPKDAHLALVTPGQVTDRQVLRPASMGSPVAITEIPGGGLFQVWSRYDIDFLEGVKWEIVGNAYDANGVQVGEEHKYAATEWEQGGPSFASIAAASLAGDAIGVVWYGASDNYISMTTNSNIYYMVVGQDGAVVQSPVNITKNELWAPWFGDPNVDFAWPSIAAMTNDRFLISWVRGDWSNGEWAMNIDYIVVNRQGQIIKDVTRYSERASHDQTSNPATCALNDGRILLLYNGAGGFNRAVFDGAGTVNLPEAHVLDHAAYLADCVRLASGEVFVAWIESAGSLQPYSLQWLLLDGDTLRVRQAPARLGLDPAQTTGTNGDLYPSVTADTTGHGIVSWISPAGAKEHNIYYATVDGTGRVVTPPMILPDGISSTSSHAVNPIVSTNGQGIARYERVVPTTTGRDAYVDVSGLAVAEPGGIAPIYISVGNLGQDRMPGAHLNVTLSGPLSVTQSSPKPDQVATNSSMASTKLIWNVPAMEFQGQGQIELFVKVPEVAYGKRFQVKVVVEAEGDAVSDNNAATAEVMVAHGMSLPELRK